MVVSPPNPGFPLASETRIAGGGLVQPYFPSGDPWTAGGVEDRSRDFEKVFAEFLSNVNSREDREREAGIRRDRELRGREDAALQSREAVLRETGKPEEADSPGKADSLHETGVPAEAPRKAEAADEKEALREIAVLRDAEAAEDRSALRPAAKKKPGESPEESAESSLAEFLLPVNAEPPNSALQSRDGTAEEGDRGEFPPVKPAEVRTGGEEISPRERGFSSGVPAKGGPAAKNKNMEKGEEESPVLYEMAGFPGGQEEALPEERVKVLDGEDLPAAAVSGETAGGLPAFPPLKPEERGEEGPPVPVLALDLGREAEKPGESRGNGRRKVEVRDYREKSLPETPAAGLSPESSERSSGQSGPAGGELLSRDFIPVELTHGAGERTAGSESRTFEGLLARELRQNLNSDIVRHAQVILRDKGEGLIRLSLRPESLGNVKIRLELTENKIAGRIIVESGEALRAFEREIASLEQAFRDSGYESAELSAFLSQGGSEEGGGEEGKPFYSPRFAMDRARYDEILERTDASFSGLSENGLGPGNGHIQVNMLI
ncbi:MAG: flagellar hook-length control protein FliK [Treponema sp.]|jgi:hypothetical protein|nr:flagellar hook-length control protein FliK [Treponema sp.]